MAFGKFLKRLRSEQRGSALIITALSMPVLIGAAGLAVDTIQWTLWKRQMQRAADSAALAGAYAVGQSKSADTSARADLVKTADLTYSVAPVVQNAPTTGPNAGNAMAVRVILNTTRAMPFSGMFMAKPPEFRVEATAAVITTSPHCLISLENGSDVGITLAGNATATLGCGVATNSRALNAIQAGGSSQLRATPITAVGGITPSGSFVGDAKLEPYALRQVDPFANLPNPTLPAPATCSNFPNGNPNDTIDLTGITGGVLCYRGGMSIKGTVMLPPNTIVYLDGGTLDLGAQAKLTGTGVTFVLTSRTADTNPGSIAKVEMNGGAELKLSAPTAGTYNGVLFYQDRRANSGENRINGNSASVIDGAIYLPKQDVLFNGTTGMKTECIQIVTRRITMSGNATITNTCPPSTDKDKFVGSRVRLVA